MVVKPARGWPIATIGMEPLPIAVGACPGKRPARRSFDPHCGEFHAHEGGKVEHPVTRANGYQGTREPLGKANFQRVENRAIDLVATGPDVRPHHGYQILLRPRESVNCGDPLGHHAAAQAAPARVYCRHRGSPDGRDENRHAVGGHHADGNAGRRGDDGIRFRRFVPATRFDADSDRSVYLAGASDAVRSVDSPHAKAVFHAARFEQRVSKQRPGQPAASSSARSRVRSSGKGASKLMSSPVRG